MFKTNTYYRQSPKDIESKKRPIQGLEDQENKKQENFKKTKFDRKPICVTPTSVSDINLGAIKRIDIKKTTPFSSDNLNKRNKIESMEEEKHESYQFVTKFIDNKMNEEKKPKIHDISLDEYFEFKQLETKVDSTGFTPNKFLVSSKSSTLNIPKPKPIHPQKRVSFMPAIDESDSDNDSLEDEFSLTGYETDSSTPYDKEEDELADLLRSSCRFDSSKMFESGAK